MFLPLGLQKRCARLFDTRIIGAVNDGLFQRLYSGGMLAETAENHPEMVLELRIVRQHRDGTFQMDTCLREITPPELNPSQRIHEVGIAGVFEPVGEGECVVDALRILVVIVGEKSGQIVGGNDVVRVLGNDAVIGGS